MARRKAAAIKQTEPENQETPWPEQPEVRSGKDITKVEAIRQALAEGQESPEKGTDFIRKTFGLEIGRQHFSSTKSQIKAKEGNRKPKGKPGRKPKASVEGYLAPPPKSAPSGGSELLEAMEAMKPLVANLGAEQVKRIVDLLS